MIKNIVKITIKVILLMSAAFFVISLISPVFRKNNSSSTTQLHYLPENSIDVLVLGSSHAQYSINPGVIYHDSGYYSFVMGSGCQPMIMSYYNLIEALKTQSPEVVLLDVFTMLPAQAVCYADGMFYNVASQFTGMTRIEAMQNIDNADKINEYLYDLAITHDRWKEDGYPSEGYLDGMFGYVSQQPNDFVYRHLVPRERSDETVQLKKKDVDALDAIINVCNENGIELILMKAMFDADQKNYDALQTVWDHAKEKGIRILDFIERAEEVGLTLGMHGDTWHNNTWGAYKTSKYIAQYLMKSELIHSHNELNELNELYQQLVALTTKWIFQDNVDIYQLMDLAAEHDVSMVVKYTGTEGYSSIGQYESDTLQQIGVHFNFIEQKHENYYAVIQNGEVVEESNQPINTVVNKTKIIVSDEKIKIGEDEFSNLGEFHIIFCNEDFFWFHEMPIDYASRFFWRNDCDGWACTFHQ